MSTYIVYEHIHLAPGSCTSVKYTQLLVKFCLTKSNLPRSSTGMASFCLINFLIHVMYVSSRTALTHELKPLEALFFAN